MIDDFGRNQVTIKKSDLLAVLKTNREAHRALFLKAQEGYRIELIKHIEQQLADARNGKPVAKIIGLMDPIDQTGDYDRVIRMLEMSTADTIILDEQKFQHYVMDDWSWKKLAVLTNNTYAANVK